MGEPRYKALLIGNSTFPEDPHNLRDLEGPRNDVPALRDALIDREAGLFDAINVRTVPERRTSEMLVELERFFQAGTKDETLMLYYSGHGVLNQRNELFLCGRDTRTDLLASTAVSAASINALIDDSAAQTTIIVLDCCYAGAFKGGDIATSLRGSGRYIMSSCRGGELSFESDVRNGLSLFTDCLSSGLVSEAVDSDGDGWLALGDLYRYVHRRMTDGSRQIPQHHFSGGGEVAIAQRRPSEPTLEMPRVASLPPVEKSGPPPGLPPRATATAPAAPAKAGHSRRARITAALVGAAATVLLLVALAVVALGGDKTPTLVSATSGPVTTVIAQVTTTSAPVGPAGTQPPATQPPATSPPATQPPATSPPPTSPPPTSPPPTSPPPVTADAVAGRWSGQATKASGQTFQVWMEIGPGCTVGQNCGHVYVTGNECRGDFYFYNLAGGAYEFEVKTFEPGSGGGCYPGAGEYLKPLPDGTLHYYTNYEGIKAIMVRV